MVSHNEYLVIVFAYLLGHDFSRFSYLPKYVEDSPFFNGSANKIYSSNSQKTSSKAFCSQYTDYAKRLNRMSHHQSTYVKNKSPSHSYMRKSRHSPAYIRQK